MGALRAPGPSARWALAALALYGALLWLTRPATPFEWDEVLYQRALDHYDVAIHSPHPPGVPAYIAAGRAAAWVTRDPLVALQAVAVASALAALVLLYRLARSLGASHAAAVAAAAALAVVPGFAFDANLGLSDVPATAGAVAAVLACVAAASDSRRLPGAAAVVALALSLRPQVAMAILPAGAAALAVACRSRRWREVGLAAAAGFAVSALLWVPAVVITGASRYFTVTRAHLRNMAESEVWVRLPALRLGDALAGWLVAPLGSPATAAAFWALVIVGGAVWWVEGRRRLVAVAAASGGVYLVVAMFTMNVMSAARYSLPGLAFVALLAGGVVAASRGSWRRLGAAAVALSCIAAAAWGLPVYLLRRDPAPVWSALTWVKTHVPREDTLVVYDGVWTPHVEYVLGRAGFVCVQTESGNANARKYAQRKTTIFVTTEPVPGADVLYRKSWVAPRLAQLSFRRYTSCVVSRLFIADGPVLSGEGGLRGASWALSGTRQIAWPDGSAPALARLCAGSEPITLHRRGAAGSQVIPPAGCTVALLEGGSEAALSVSAPPGTTTVVPPIRVAALPASAPLTGASSAYLVPQVARRQGRGGAFWRTDLLLINPTDHQLNVAARFLPTGRDNTAARQISGTLAAGELLLVPDVLGAPEFAGEGTLGALLVHALDRGGACLAGGCNFVVLARTYNAEADTWRAGEWMPGVPASHALSAGETAVVRHVTSNAATRATFGVASWSGHPVAVVARVVDAAGRVVERDRLEVPVFGHAALATTCHVEDGRVEFSVADAAAGALVVPYASMVNRTTGLPTHLLPDAMPARPLPAGWRPPLPRVAEVR